MRTPYTGVHEIILTALQGKLVDLDNCQGLRTDLPGYPGVEKEITDSSAAARTAAGIPQDMVDEYLLFNQTIVEIDQHLINVEKLAEVLKESRAHYVDMRNNSISMMVDAMRSKAKRRKDASPMVAFDKTVRYYSQLGEKAAETRKKNAEAAEAEAAEAGDTTAPAPEPVPAPGEPQAA